MGGPSNKINRPRPEFRSIQRQKRKQLKANPPARKKESGSFPGGMSKYRRAKGGVQKRKFNVSTNNMPSGKRLRKLLKARMRDEKETNDMQVAIVSTDTKSRPKRKASKAKKQAKTDGETESKDVEMKDV